MPPHRPGPAPELGAADPLSFVVDLARRVWRRAPIGYWLGVIAAAALAAAIVASSVRTSSRVTAALGPLVRVPVAAIALAPGDAVGDGDVRWARLPRRTLPKGAIADEPVGHTALVAVLEGEVLMQAKLAPWGVRGPAALMPPGTRAVAVPHGPAVPPVAPGDVVDLLATIVTEAEAGAPSEPTFVVAEAALVVEVGDDAVTVAVAAADASRVAFAITAGTITIALTGTGF